MPTEMTEGAYRARLKFFRRANGNAACTADKTKWAALWDERTPKDSIAEHV